MEQGILREHKEKNEKSYRPSVDHHLVHLGTELRLCKKFAILFLDRPRISGGKCVVVFFSSYLNKLSFSGSLDYDDHHHYHDPLPEINLDQGTLPQAFFFCFFLKTVMTPSWTSNIPEEVASPQPILLPRDHQITISFILPTLLSH